MGEQFGFGDLFGFEHARRWQDLQQEAFSKLLADPLMDRAEVGDTVLVAAGLIGRGYPWIRHECVVTGVGDTSYKVKHASKDKYDNWEEWVHSALVTDIVSRANKVE